jgi:hypothetical protein
LAKNRDFWLFFAIFEATPTQAAISSPIPYASGKNVSSSRRPLVFRKGRHSKSCIFENLLPVGRRA